MCKSQIKEAGTSSRVSATSRWSHVTGCCRREPWNRVSLALQLLRRGLSRTRCHTPLVRSTLVVASACHLTGRLLSRLASKLRGAVSVFRPIDCFIHGYEPRDIEVMVSISRWSRTLWTSVAWAALWSSLLGDFCVGDSAYNCSSGDWCTLSPSVDGSTGKRSETTTGVFREVTWTRLLWF
jgi:hypothetical protein